MLTEEQRVEFFTGHKIIDAVVQHKRKFFFVLVNKEDPNTQRVVRVTVGDDGEELAKAELYNYGDDQSLEEDNLYAEMSYPEEKIIVFDPDGQYYHGQKRSQPPIPPYHAGGPSRGLVSRVKSIQGSRAIVSTFAADLMIRGEDETWSRIGPEITDDHPAYASYGGVFSDFDGFSLTDIYGGGSTGLYHFDGVSWTKTDGPQDLVTAVCCAPTGDVYAATWQWEEAAVYRGRGGEWKKIYKQGIEFDTAPTEYRDLVWHDGLLWGGYPHGITAFKDGKIKYALTDHRKHGSLGGHLSARDGVLLVAGFDRASWRDEKGKWHHLLGNSE